MQRKHESHNSENNEGFDDWKTGNIHVGQLNGVADPLRYAIHGDLHMARLDGEKKAGNDGHGKP